MLLIECPYCGERPEPEFVYGGQAHMARPQQPAEVSAQQWADYLDSIKAGAKLIPMPATAATVAGCFK